MTTDETEVRSVTADENTGRPVRVYWTDSGLSVTGWKTFSELPKDVSHCESIGMWMGENERVVMLGGSRDAADGNWNETQLLYKPCITSIEWLDQKEEAS